jgi:hypothetical protein
MRQRTFGRLLRHSTYHKLETIQRFEVERERHGEKWKIASESDGNQPESMACQTGGVNSRIPDAWMVDNTGHSHQRNTGNRTTKKDKRIPADPGPIGPLGH